MTAVPAPPRVGGSIAANARGVRAGARREIRELRRSPDQMMALVTAPLLTLTFLAIMMNAGRHDLAPYAVLAPALIVLWQMALQSSGHAVESERENGSLEALVATPSPLPAVIGGRILTVTVVSMVGFFESWLVAGLVFGVWIEVFHPAALVLTVLATGYATAGSAVILAALFVTTRSARTLQNALTYPIYVLGGVIVPVAMLPMWLEPFTRLVFLSWSADLLRDSLADGPIIHLAPRLGMVVLLGTVAIVIGHYLVKSALGRARRTGSIGHA